MFAQAGARGQKRKATRSAIVVTFDGGGATLSTGVKGYVRIPYGGTIVEVDAVANQSGSIVVDIWKCTYSQFDAGATHPVSGDSITGTDQVTISSATKVQDSTLTGWKNNLVAGDILGFNINSVTSIQRLTMTIYYNRSQT